MSLLEKIAGLAEERSPDLVDKLVDKARGLADDHLNGPERDLAKRALDRLGESSEALGHLGAGGLISVLARLHLGQEDQAERAFMIAGMDFQEVLDAQDASTDGVIRERLNREAYWLEVRELVKDLGQIAVKVIPLLLMAA
jgi:hypothetical protein